jgi:hypothetical protein
MNFSKPYADIDYTFRPTSYWAPPSDVLEAALSNVKGRNRREMIRDYYQADRLEYLHPDLLADSLDTDARPSLSRIDRSFMGGEYLPEYKRNEVEIARVELESTTFDVISVRARPSGSRILYRICDEHESKYKLPQNSSSRPLSLGELIGLLNATSEVGLMNTEWNRFGFVLSFNLYNLDGGSYLEELEHFTPVTSDVYPQLGKHYSRVIAEWYAAQLAERFDPDA